MTRQFGYAAAILGLWITGVQAKDVPMKGTLSGVAVIEYGEQQPDHSFNVVIPVGSTGQGNVSHLGRTTLTETHTTIVLASTAYQTTEVVDGLATITAANGDQIFLSFGGTGVRTAQGFNDTFTYQITGGTGRFAGATGSGTISSADQGVSLPFVDARGHVVETAPFVFDLEGVISSVGS